MVQISVAGTCIEAEYCKCNINKYQEYTDDGYCKLTTTTIKIHAPDVNIKQLVEEWDERQREAEYGNVGRLGIRSYAGSTIGKQDPLGYYEEWRFPDENTIVVTGTHENGRDPNHST